MCKPTMRTTIALTTVLAFLSMSAGSRCEAKKIRQKIRNDTGMQANDLRIRTASPIGDDGARIRRDDDGDGALEDGETVENASSVQGSTARWNTGDIMNVNIGDEVFLEIDSGNIQNTSMWTKDGEDIGRITKVGRPSELVFAGFDQQTALVLANDDEFPILYQNLQVFAHNSREHFDSFDRVFHPTGEELPLTFQPTILEPGQSLQVPLGFFGPDPSSYFLISAEASSLERPDVVLSVESAVMVPDGDINGDRVTDGFDIDPFVQLLSSGLDAYLEAFPDHPNPLDAVDFNADGQIDGFDVDPFVRVLSGAGVGPGALAAVGAPEPGTVVLGTLLAIAALLVKPLRRN